METISELELKLLGLSAPERERLALAAWESLVGDVAAAADANLDPEGVSLAKERDTELESSDSETISHKEFHRRTGDG